MGAEAACVCRWSGGSGSVKALLEPSGLILRGALRRTIPLDAIHGLRVDGGALSFEAGGETMALELGAAVARKWATKITAPPPSLAEKLGFGTGAKALVIGPVDDAALCEALAQAGTTRPGEYTMSLAVVRDADALKRAIGVHESHASGAQVWVVHEKGARAAFGERPVREIMRGLGYMDNKVAAVSDTLSATRYKRSSP